MEESAAPRQLSLLPSSTVPLQFRLDAETRRRGLRHIAEIRLQIDARRAARADLTGSSVRQPVPSRAA